jgi:hypothetical protein
LRSDTLTSKPYAAWVAVLVGLLGAGLLTFAFTRPSSPPRAPSVVADGGESARQAPQPLPPAAGKRSSVGGSHAGVEDLISGPVLPAAQPLSVSIPRLHVASRLVRLGVDDRGAMQVPDDPATAGWYRLGPTPGALGPAVIAGHVTWNQVPAVFFQLAKLRHGDVVKVAREDDRVAVFKVTHVTRYMKSEFPTRAVFGGIDHAGLRLITCGGEFDSSSHRYSDNVVAFATLVSAHRTERDLP